MSWFSDWLEAQDPDDFEWVKDDMEEAGGHWEVHPEDEDDMPF